MIGLQSAELKLTQAEKHIDAIRDISWNYTEREPNVILKHPDGSREIEVHRGPSLHHLHSGEDSPRSRTLTNIAISIRPSRKLTEETRLRSSTRVMHSSTVVRVEDGARTNPHP
jgi:hypothetical protein